MQRRKKHHLPDEVYESQNHVVSITVCTADRGRWLQDRELATLVRQEILLLHDDYPIIGYCVMPDHIHLLLCNAGSSLSKIMNGYKGRTSRLVRKIRPGLAVWHPSYWDHIVRREDGLHAALKYIFLNPVRAGLVNDWWEHEWLGAPMMGEVGPDFFTHASPEDIVWRELFGGGP